MWQSLGTSQDRRHFLCLLNLFSNLIVGGDLLGAPPLTTVASLPAGDSLHFCLQPQAKIKVATSVCTGGSNMPPAYCILHLRIPIRAKIKIAIRMDGNFYWQRMRDSNPRERSQSPVCYRYTNPLSGPYLLYAKFTKCQEIFLIF